MASTLSPLHLNSKDTSSGTNPPTQPSPRHSPSLLDLLTAVLRMAQVVKTQIKQLHTYSGPPPMQLCNDVDLLIESYILVIPHVPSASPNMFHHRITPCLIILVKTLHSAAQLFLFDSWHGVRATCAAVHAMALLLDLSHFQPTQTLTLAPEQLVEITGLMEHGIGNHSCLSHILGHFPDGHEKDAPPHLLCGVYNMIRALRAEHPATIHQLEQQGLKKMGLWAALRDCFASRLSAEDLHEARQTHAHWFSVQEEQHVVDMPRNSSDLLLKLATRVGALQVLRTDDNLSLLWSMQLLQVTRSVDSQNQVPWFRLVLQVIVSAYLRWHCFNRKQKPACATSKNSHTSGPVSDTVTLPDFEPSSAFTTPPKAAPCATLCNPPHATTSSSVDPSCFSPASWDTLSTPDSLSPGSPSTPSLPPSPVNCPPDLPSLYPDTAPHNLKSQQVCADAAIEEIWKTLGPVPRGIKIGPFMSRVGNFGDCKSEGVCVSPARPHLRSSDVDPDVLSTFLPSPANSSGGSKGTRRKSPGSGSKKKGGKRK